MCENVQTNSDISAHKLNCTRGKVIYNKNGN